MKSIRDVMVAGREEITWSRAPTCPQALTSVGSAVVGRAGNTEPGTISWKTRVIDGAETGKLGWITGLR